MSTEEVGTEIRQFIKTYVKSKQGEIAGENSDVFTVTYPNDADPHEYTYEPAIARETKAQLITAGSPAFQQILKECLENGAPCQVLVRPKESFEAVVKKYCKDSEFDCQSCRQLTAGEETIHLCTKTQPCYHQVNNGKIVSVDVGKTEPVRYFLFYFLATFQNKLRPKSEEKITVLMDEKGNFVPAEDFNEDSLLKNGAIELQDYKTKLKPDILDKLKTVADEKLSAILKEKVALYDLPLNKEKKAKLRSFEKRLRRERREHVISKKHDFDYVKWQSNYEALFRREEESYLTNIAVKFINLLVINTAKAKFEIKLNNKAVIPGCFILGINHSIEVNCPICHKSFSEGYATQDGLYVCADCTRQSIDTGKIYSKKAPLVLDEKLNEYIERDGGFICSVCGKKHSKLLEFKCSHDNSSVCIYHYGLCDICGKVFSKQNLTYTDEFQRKLCPKHAKSKEP